MPPPSVAFQDGRRDRGLWEKWFAGTVGDFKDGAEYWAGQRRQTDPVSCYGQGGEDWTADCLAAKRILTPTDARGRPLPVTRMCPEPIGGDINQKGRVSRCRHELEQSPVLRPEYRGFG